MDATTLAPDAALPDDVPTLQGMVRQLLTEVARLRGQLDAALKPRFGRRSERQPKRSTDTKRPRVRTTRTDEPPCPSTSSAGKSSTI
jgi:hypothetical protein